MTSQSGQSGYILLFVLGVLLSGSAVFLELTGVGGAVHSSTKSASALRSPLQYSRQQLLSYTAAYPYLYGARSAGPGHLPCPDTDSSVFSSNTALQVHDGPDPPCGSRETARGKLPRQVSLSGSRYAFTDLASQRLHYEVDSQVINNPVNRIVNPSTLRVEGKQHAEIVAISRPPGPDELLKERLRMPRAVITANALLLAIRPSVSAWVIDRLESLGTDSCLQDWHRVDAESTDTLAAQIVRIDNSELPVTHGSNEPGADAVSATQSLIGDNERCRRLQRAHEFCSSQNPPVITASVQNEADNNAGHGVRLLLLLADSTPMMKECSVDWFDQLSMEHVPITSHWFYRNRWYEWMVIDSNSGCELSNGKPCALSYRAQYVLEHLTEPLVLQWAH